MLALQELDKANLQVLCHPRFWSKEADTAQESYSASRRHYRSESLCF